MAKNKLAQPFLKWAGGKRQLLPEIRKYVPKRINTYYEPFIGAGAVLFDIQPKRAVINDINSELASVYNVIKNNVDELIEDLKKHENDKDYFYEIRDLDRQEEYKNLSPVQRASRIIYLNKTCFNGLFRVNSQGQFNVPFGKYKNPQIVNEIVLRAVHNYLSSNNVTILNGDFETAVEKAKKGDFVYFDPPYDPVSDTSSFTGYSLDGFNKDDQRRLKYLFVELDKRGVNVLLSNSATDFIQELYEGFNIQIVSASRNINANASGRGKIDEVLVMNYEPNR
ncbi:DNA adenine methylase [Bacillus paranthracis]|uniref:Site-specific DNA-methyltransferase (adenine-specific) n=1 Tax=Bacillus cytotoxicus (strain DSM 22905 / CIP 110041 / 391-98 / NVH 391-98) TaxID=315749 RepID=A7GVL4_BACCN|nr:MULTISPECIES: DNA adenine methylase [Bacillus cereus group]HDR4640430.1 DNA adenine methylase [Bacillus cereus]ABS24172.1 DNA adenine methylase [Bacillus cytotoxicus NVH 391-98]AWC46764.1 DNA methyltransferase [Bacillus cytotoxicus]MCC2358803.1 DNA adenine methylase [Bacillus paranthracis]MCU5134898.1 DNA adenine methylase [Bacillus paranthracis]